MPGLTVCSPVAHQHPCDGPRTASPQCTEQLQEPVRTGKGWSAGVGAGGHDGLDLRRLPASLPLYQLCSPLVSLCFSVTVSRILQDPGSTHLLWDASPDHCSSLTLFAAGFHSIGGCPPALAIWASGPGPEAWMHQLGWAAAA